MSLLKLFDVLLMTTNNKVSYLARSSDIKEDLVMATLMYKTSEASTSSYLTPVRCRTGPILSNAVLKQCSFLEVRSRVLLRALRATARGCCSSSGCRSSIFVIYIDSIVTDKSFMLAASSRRARYSSDLLRVEERDILILEPWNNTCRSTVELKLESYRGLEFSRLNSPARFGNLIDIHGFAGRF
ncbi:hypothetical protein KCU89_g7, partial [Aureobasidium melanogenum]